MGTEEDFNDLYAQAPEPTPNPTRGNRADMPAKKFTREELEAYLDDLDKQDEVKARDAKIAALELQLAKIRGERDENDMALKRLEETIRTFWSTLAPFKESLEAGRRERLYQGRRLAIDPKRVEAAVSEKEKSEEPAKKAAKGKPKASEAEIRSRFPKLSEG